MKLRLAVDQDQVLADLLGEWLRRYNEDYGDNLQKDDVTDWMIDGFVKPECGKKIYDYLDDPDIFLNLPVIEHAVEVVRELSEQHEIFIVTAPFNANNVIPKSLWLQKHFPFIDEKNYVFARDKSIIRANMLIDDKIGNLDTFEGIKVLFDAPHNRKFKKWTRVYDWIEVKEFVEWSESEIFCI